MINVIRFIYVINYLIRFNFFKDSNSNFPLFSHYGKTILKKREYRLVPVISCSVLEAMQVFWIVLEEDYLTIKI